MRGRERSRQRDERGADRHGQCASCHLMISSERLDPRIASMLYGFGGGGGGGGVTMRTWPLTTFFWGGASGAPSRLPTRTPDVSTFSVSSGLRRASVICP